VQGYTGAAAAAHSPCELMGASGKTEAALQRGRLAVLYFYSPDRLQPLRHGARGSAWPMFQRPPSISRQLSLPSTQTAWERCWG
jgi:hypothetical protein